MPRPPRLLLSQSYYHIMVRGNNRNRIFRRSSDYYKYLELIARYKIEHPFKLFHYCLMPNHAHLLVKTNKATDFASFMKKLGLAYMYHYKREYGWIGHFWQDRYKSQPVGKDEYFIQCGKYIELNPVHAGLVKLPQEYEFSSFRFYSQGLSSYLLTTDPFYKDMGKTSNDRKSQYLNLVISDYVNESYLKQTWGSPSQRYNENKKIKNKLRKNTNNQRV